MSAKTEKTVDSARVRELGTELMQVLGYQPALVVSVELTHDQARVTVLDTNEDGKVVGLARDAEGRKTEKWAMHVETIELA